MTDFVHHTQQHKKFTPLIRYWNWLLLQNITHSFSYIYFYRIIAFPNSVCLNSQKNLGVRENLDVVIPNYFVPLCKIQLQPKLLGKTYKYKSRGIWHMGVRKKGFQLIAIPFHYFVENRLINHQRNHISSNCLSSPSNTQFRDHLVWNRAFLCVLQATLLKQETYTTPKEDKAWRDQKRVAVQHQNLHHEEQGQAGKKDNTKPKPNQKNHPFEFADGGLPSAFLWASLLEERPSAAEKQTFQSTSRCAQILVMCFSFSSQHALDLFLIKACLFSLMTCKAVMVLTSAVFEYLTRFKISVLSNSLTIPWGPVVVFLNPRT